VSLRRRERDAVAEPVGDAVHDERDAEKHDHAAGALPQVTDKDEQDGQRDHQERGLELIHTPEFSTSRGRLIHPLAA